MNSLLALIPPIDPLFGTLCVAAVIAGITGIIYCWCERRKPPEKQIPPGELLGYGMVDTNPHLWRRFKLRGR